MNIQSFRTTTVPILGLPFGSPEKKWHLNVVPTEKHKIYYKEQSGASSQRLQAMLSLCLKLSLLSPSHHFHSICTNHFFLVVHVDLIFNSCLWVHPNPIPELLHAFLLTKCYELGSVTQFSSFSIVLFQGPTFKSPKEFGGASPFVHMWFDDTIDLI
jgi:hypothetical protein